MVFKMRFVFDIPHESIHNYGQEVYDKELKSWRG